MRESTRITPHSRTIIDYVVSNIYNINSSIEPNLKISDHETIIIGIPVRNKNSNSQIHQKIEYFFYDKLLFKKHLDGRNLEYDEGQSIDNNVIKIETILKGIISNNTKTKISAYRKSKRWFSHSLKKLKTEKIKAYQVAKLANTLEKWELYTKIRNKYKMEINNTKNKYIRNTIINTEGQQLMWKKIKELVLCEETAKIDCVEFEGVEYDDDNVIANKFNIYFIQSIEEINRSIEYVQYVNYIEEIKSVFKFREITLGELYSICKTLKNKSDFLGISKGMITDNWSKIGHTLLAMVNTSITRGVFPNSLKESMITPVQKINKPKRLEEFRPINTLKTIEKILESVVKQQLIEYLEVNELFSKFQSGFRKHHSCETAINYIIDEWKTGAKQNKIMAVFLDFKRAFETIDREILVQKMYKYGIRDMELEWFKSYLEERHQRTKVNGKMSEYLKTKKGVPQGSILGPILFTLYINDLEMVIRNCKIILYADDTLIYAEGENEEECKSKIRVLADIDVVTKWLKMNKLKLNEKKTKMLEINIKGTFELKINNNKIEKINTIKYLGVIIDKELKFKYHIEYICRKIGKKLAYFRRIRNKVDIMTAIKIYNVMIKPHFEYCSTITYTCCNQAQMERLQKLQNKGMRHILKCSRYTSIKAMLETLKWLSVKERLELNTLMAIHKIKNKNAPLYLVDKIEYVKEVQKYELRNNEDFRIKYRQSNKAQHSMLYIGLKLYNTLPMETKNEKRYIAFKQKCVEFIKNRRSLAM